jgi:hypothetical protein
MAQETRYNSYGDRFDEPVDLDEMGSQFGSYPATRPIPTREDYFSDDSVPLFLSGSDEVPRPRASGKIRDIARRPIRTSIVLIAAAVTCYAVMSVKNPFPVFANATATLIGMPDVRSAPVPSAPANQPTASVQAVSPTTRDAPSRDEIALAIKAAHQSLAPAEIRQPAAATPLVAAAPPVTVAPPARKLGADELATLMTRARSLLAAGDIPPARLLLERAAEAQEASAALMLAQTYDPAVMGAQDTRNINTDPALARSWYQRAVQLGSTDAQRRLSQLQ